MAGRKVAKASTVAVSHYEEEDVGAGFEDFTQDDVAIPFLNILQQLSPQVDKDDSSYVEGAEAGKIINSVTNDLFNGNPGVAIIPVHRVHSFIEWVPRDEGGGFVGQHSPDDPMVLQEKAAGAFGKMKTPEGNDLVETFTVFGIQVMPDESYTPVVLSFSKSNIQAYKRWMTRARSITLRSEDGRRVTPPLFSHIYQLNTIKRENPKGKWHAWNISFSGENAEQSRLEPDNELYQAAKEFRSLVTSGIARAATETIQQEDSTNDDTF